jgi:hypothetical protein
MAARSAVTNFNISEYEAEAASGVPIALPAEGADAMVLDDAHAAAGGGGGGADAGLFEDFLSGHHHELPAADGGGGAAAAGFGDAMHAFMPFAQHPSEAGWAFAL